MSQNIDHLVEVASEAAWKNICATHAEPGPYLEWVDVPEPAKRLVRDRQRAGLEAVLPLVEGHLDEAQVEIRRLGTLAGQQAAALARVEALLVEDAHPWAEAEERKAAIVWQAKIRKALEAKK